MPAAGRRAISVDVKAQVEKRTMTDKNVDHTHHLTGEQRMIVAARRLFLLLILLAPLTAAASVVTNPVEGFVRLIVASNSGDRPTDRSLDIRSPSSWAFGQDRSQTVTWETEPVAADAAPDPVTFVWSAGLSGEAGQHELEVDGQRILTFSSGPFDAPQQWQEGDVELRFEPGLTFWRGEVHGTMYLRLPRHRLVAGQPIRISVRAVDHRAWFMLHHFRDSYAYSQTSRVHLPSGRTLIVTPPKSFYLPPATIDWQAPFAVGGDKAVTEDVEVTAELLDDTGASVIESLQRLLQTDVEDRSLPISLWSSDGLPAGAWQLRLTFAAAGASVGDRWQGAVVIGDASAFEAEASRAEAALQQASMRVDAGSVVADISLPSAAWRLRDTRRKLLDITDAEFFAASYAALRDTLASVTAAAERIANGQDPYAGHTGYAVKAYRAAWDGQLQPYGLQVPATYTPSRRWPLVIMLHGSSGDQESAMGAIFGARRQPPPYKDYGYLVATPDTRGILGWDNYIGEEDVLRVITDVQRSHVVDADRIYLTGLSMGGDGVWQIGLRYADLFAALAPVCAATTWRLFDDSVVDTLTAAVRDESSPLPHAENALHLPIAMHHGALDQSVRVEHSRRMAVRLQDLGYDVQYTEYPEVDHDVWTQAYADGRMFAWFDSYRRDPAPAKVVHVTANPRRYGRSYWVRIEALQTPHALGRITAEAHSGNRVTVRTDNVRQLSLQLDTPLLDPQRQVTIVVDGATCYTGMAPAGGWLPLQLESGDCTVRPDDATEVGPPYAGLWGALLDYHVIVYGTRGSQDVTDRYQAFAERITRTPRQLRLQLRTLADTTVTDALQTHANLVLIGTPETNTILADLAADLPIHWEDGRPAIGTLRAGDGEVLMVTYPHPRFPDRRLLVLTAGATEAIEQIRFVPRGAPEIVILGADGTIRVTGTFTRDWQVVKLP